MKFNIRFYVVAIVFNDGAYGNVKAIQRTRYGGREIASTLENPDFVTLAKAFNTLAVTDGVITATPNAYKGILATETCVLTPTVTGDRLTWVFSGGCVTQNYVKAS